MLSPVLSTVLLVVLATVMFGLGLSLTLSDFARVATAPRAVIVTLACQTILLPAVCFGLVLALDLAPTTAIGLMVLAASPGGPMSGVFSHLAGGDVALSVTTTAVNALLSLITMPLIILLALAAFLPATTAVAVPPAKVIQVLTVVLVPVAIGMVVRRRAPDLARRMHRPVRVVAVAAVAVAMAGAVAQQVDVFLLETARVGSVVITFSVLSLGLGYLVPRLLRIDHRQAVAAGLEIGIHNAVVAITVAVSVLGIPAVAVAPALYGALMFGPASAFAWLVSRRRPARERAADQGREPATG